MVSRSIAVVSRENKITQIILKIQFTHTTFFLYRCDTQCNTDTFSRMYNVAVVPVFLPFVLHESKGLVSVAAGKSTC